MSNTNVDFSVLRATLNATKPPYKCPIKDCEKIYRSFNGMQQHFDDHEDRLQKNNRKKNRNMDINSLRDKANKKIVEVELGGQLIQFDASKPMKLVATENGKKPSCITVLKTSKMTSQKNHSHSFEKSDVGILSSSLPEPKFKILDTYVRRPTLKRTCSSDPGSIPLEEIVLYDADEEDLAWLELLNEDRSRENLPALTRDTFEHVLDKFESSCHFEHRPDKRSGHAPTTRDEDAICSVCQDGECLNTNVILFCDLCNLAVHQECYGVPHIPEGPWICRRCLLSPSKAVDCCLCPSKIGAMKQTDDGKWAHIVCALWIPDAGFANSVFLEPIDGIERISPARWKLMCHVCHRRSAGACIQCHKVSCYTAFHVTCAQQAGLHMKIESSNSDPSPEQDDHHHQSTSNASQEHLAKFSIAQSNWSKKVYCNFHTPSCEMPSNENGGRLSGSEEGGSTGQVAPPMKAAIRRVRKLVAEGREFLPLLSFPSLDSKRYDLIRDSLQLDDRNEVMEKLKNYWLLKRRSRNGVPLVTYPNSYCLKKAEESLEVETEEKVADEVDLGHDDDDDDDDADDDSLSEEGSTMESEVIDDNEPAELDEQKKEFRQMKKLRQELERVRLLNELTRKRERVKMKMLDHDELLLQYKLNPVQALFDVISSSSEDKGFSSLLNDDDDDDDGGGGGADGDGVDDADDTDDTSSSRPQSALRMSDIVRKIEALEYDSVREFEADFGRFCDSKRSKVNPRRKGKVTTLKRMGLRMIRRYAAAVSSLAATSPTKTSNNDIGDSSPNIPANTQIGELEQEPGRVDVDVVETESSDARKVPIRSPSPSSFVPPLPMSAAVPLSSEQVLTSPTSPTATTSSSSSSRVQATASSSVHPLHLMRPPNKRDRHGRGVFGSSPHDPKFRGIDPSSNHRLDENDNLRLLAETADSISSENSYSVDPNPDNSSSLTGSVNSRHPEESGQSHYPVVPEPNQPQSSTQTSDQLCAAAAVPNLNDSQLKTIEACDSTTDWPSMEEADSSPKRKAANQNHPTGRKRKISRSSKNSSDVNNHKRTRSPSNNENVDDDDKDAAGDDDDNDDESSKVKSAKMSSKTGADKNEGNGVVRRETRRKSTDMRDLDDFLVPLSHGDFVWAQYGKYPSYPAIVVSPTNLKHESNGITRGRSARGQEGLVGANQDDIIPIPASEVVKANSDKEKYLVCFFDQKRTWQWVSRSKLDPLGVDSGLDKKRMSEVKRTVTKKTIVEAYKKALKQRCVRYRENYARSLAVVLDQ